MIDGTEYAATWNEVAATPEHLHKEDDMAETQSSKETSQRARAHRRVTHTDVPVQHLVDYMAQMYNLYAFLEDHP